LSKTRYVGMEPRGYWYPDLRDWQPSRWVLPWSPMSQHGALPVGAAESGQHVGEEAGRVAELRTDEAAR
jgi:hypothetical protein